ncbi:MAG: LpxD N-terminal domain-containing protein [Betaproteobacteria bacterium]
MTQGQSSDVFVRRIPQALTARALHERLEASIVIGDGGRKFDSIAALGSALPDALTFCDAANAAGLLAATRAAVVITPIDAAVKPRPDQTLVAVADVRAAFIDTVAWLLPGDTRPPTPAGIDVRARIDATAWVSPHANVAASVTIGARTRIEPGAVIYDDSIVGDDCVVGPNAVVGWVGLAYHDSADGRRMFFPHLAGVRIGNGVDIGAQACVCRGMLSHTRIGDDAKIGSLVYVSHGVVIAARSWLSAGTAVAGHATIAEDSLLGIGSIVIDNVVIGAGVLVAGGSIVTRHADAGERLLGVPACPVTSMRRFGPTPRE